MILLDVLLFSRDKIHKLPQSAMKKTLLEIIKLSPEEILEDVVNYWCFTNCGMAVRKKMHYVKYGKIMKAIVPKTKDIAQFHKEISDRLKRLI